MSDKKSVIFVPHGGGPLPLLDHEPHRELSAFLRAVPEQLIMPKVIILITAHWESSPVQVSAMKQPGMLFDYFGFPEESYHYRYAAQGEPVMAQSIVDTLNKANIPAQTDHERGFDHGTFVPLMLMFPEASIPVIQMSLQATLDPALHIKIGEQLAQYVSQGALIVGSGLSFHNLNSMRPAQSNASKESLLFDQWLTETVSLSGDAASKRLADWETAPYARYCHPREEHLLPLHVCFGVAKALGKPMDSLYSKPLMGSQVSAFAA